MNKQILLYYYETSGRLVFICFLEEIEDTKKHFEIIWPLVPKIEICSKYFLNKNPKNHPLWEGWFLFFSLPSKTGLEADFLSIQRDYLYGQLLLCHHLNEILRFLRQIHRIRSQIWEIWEI